MAKVRPKPPVWPSPPPHSLLPLWSLLGSLGSSAQDPALGLSLILQSISYVLSHSRSC